MLFLLAQGSANNTFPHLGACWGATSRGSQTWQLPAPPRHNCTPPLRFENILPASSHTCDGLQEWRLVPSQLHLEMKVRSIYLTLEPCPNKLTWALPRWWPLLLPHSLLFLSIRALGQLAHWHCFFTGRWHIFIPHSASPKSGCKNCNDVHVVLLSLRRISVVFI